MSAQDAASSDIEKLIKQTIKRGELAGFSPSARAAEERHGERRTPRREGERSPAGNGHAGASASPYAGSNGSHGARPDRGPRPSGPRRDKVDPWFLKPYEPSRGGSTAVTPAPSPSKPKPKLAALLGGLRKE